MRVHPQRLRHPGLRAMAQACTLALASGWGTSTHAACSFGADQCLPGYVWRDALAGDHVCVPPAQRDQAAQDNAQAARRHVSGAYGPDTCVPGYVWRELTPQDHVCVSGATRAQVVADNRSATAHRDPACAGGVAPLAVTANTGLTTPALGGGVLAGPLLGSAPRRTLPSAQTGGGLSLPTPSAGGGLQLTPPTPATVPLATASADLRRAAVANFDRIAGSVGISGTGILLGGYTTIDAGSRMVVNLQAVVPGSYRVRVTVSNIAGPTGLIFDSASGTSTCALRGQPGYRSLQTCEVLLQAGGPGGLTLALRKQADAVAQATLAAVDVSHEAAPGSGADASAQISLSGIASASFDKLPGAMLTVSAQPVSVGVHVEVDNRTQLDANLLNAPAGTYRFRALINNTRATTVFNLQGQGREWNCSVPAQPGYQATQACDLLLPVASAGIVTMHMKLTAAAGAPVASIEQVLVFKEP